MPTDMPVTAARPPVDPDSAAHPIFRILKIMEALRDPDTGCPWDVAQSFATIAPYTIEEAYEVVDAIERADMADLRDELGDLLLQVVFHSRIAEDAGHFSFANVAAGISDKMERRHPHVFGGTGSHNDWEQIKARERTDKSGDASALAGVARALPALMVAEKLQKRAARTGFDWEDALAASEKVTEELAEVHGATTDAERLDEVGDLLFAAVNVARHYSVDPEVALRAANAKFERRFRAMEAMAPDFAALTLEDKETLWVAVKSRETG